MENVHQAQLWNIFNQVCLCLCAKMPVFYKATSKNTQHTTIMTLKSHNK